MHIQDDFDNIVTAVRKEIATWSDEDQNTFFTMPYQGVSLSTLHNTLGRYVRNKFNLWEYSWDPEIIDNIDYSPFHPDQLSITIIEAAWQKGKLK